MSNFQKHLDEKLQNREFQEEWEKSGLRYRVIEEILKLRNSYQLSQAEFAKKVGTTQAVISRIENGTVNVGIDFLEKVAKAFDKRVELEIV